MFCLFFQPEFASKNGVLATTELAESSILEDLPPAIISDAFAQMVSWLSRYIILFCEAQRLWQDIQMNTIDNRYYI